MANDQNKRALDYHEFPRPGKIEISPTKPLANQNDLALAYSPGVAAPCLEIAKDPHAASRYTDRNNLVAVVTNGTAVLGLGDIGPLAAKPVMEGKGVLFKKFAGIDVFDIEISETDPDRIVDIVAALEPTFGGINLEDIKSPECFEIEEKLKARVDIPVFHDDQHGTAIISAAAIVNGLKLTGKSLESVKLVTSGAGAAAIACLNLLLTMGLPIENITLTDRSGVVYKGRKEGIDASKAPFAKDTDARTLADAIDQADIFLGLSAAGVLSKEMVATMAAQPIILALANPTPEIMPEEVKEVRDDAIIATGRSDYPNQVNNVLCFPYIFRGALDVGATTINDAMKIACVEALAELTMHEASEIVVSAYGGNELSFGREYIIPKPFDPRLISVLAPAVAKAAMETGVATLPIDDIDAYAEQLEKFVFHTALFMRPVFGEAKKAHRKIVYADGEEPKVLRAVQSVADEHLAMPILIGRPSVIEHRIKQLGLRLTADKDYELVNPESDPRYRDYAASYYEIMKRRGLTLEAARTEMRTNNTVIAAMLVHKGAAAGMLCGNSGSYHSNLRHIEDILGRREDTDTVASLNVLVLRKGTLFICDTYVNEDPNAAQIAEMTLLAAEQVKLFGMTPRVALLSHANYGASNSESSKRMREALGLIQVADPGLEIDGEMQADTALIDAVRERAMPDSPLTGAANLLVMPNVESANIALNLLTVMGEGVSVGPILLGIRHPAHVLTPSCTVRRIINMTALAVVEAGLFETT